MKKYLKKYGVLIIFIIFFFMVFIQHQFIYLHHDDYGYASLSYAYVVDSAKGHDLHIGEIMEFLKGHYDIWGGRVLYFFIEIILISNGVWLYRLFQSITITLIFYLIYKIIQKMTKDSINKLILAICTISLYGVFEINLLNHGIFWFSASVLYIIPMLPFLAFIYLYQDSKNKKYKNRLSKIVVNIFYGILIFLSTFSQEQIGVAALGYVVILTIYNYIKSKKIDKKDIIMIMVAIIGFAILMLAPGNKVRQEDISSMDFYSKSFIERIILGIQNMILGNFSSDTKFFNILFYLSVAYISIKNIRINNKNKIKTIFYMISLLSIFIIIYTSIIKSEGYFKYLFGLKDSNTYRLLVTFIFIIQLLLMFFSTMWYLYEEKKLKLINILICAVLSIACMIVAPYFAVRSSIIFMVLCFIFILYSFIDMYTNIENKKVFICAIIPIVILSFSNIIIITKGYYNNNLANKENSIILEDASKKISAGEKIEKITLKKMPNILYGAAQPYMAGSEYILYYIKEYYNLPMDIEIIYE